MYSSIEREVMEAINSYYEAGKNKDFSLLASMFAPEELFSKFDENPPYTRQNARNAFALEQAKYSNISDLEYQIQEPKVNLLAEDVAVATFYLYYKGIVVNDYSFEGSKYESYCRVSVILKKFNSAWKIVHMHSSKLPVS